MGDGEHQIEVDGIWKVFGNRPERALQEKYLSKSNSEVRDELGLVVALRDVSFTVDPGQIFVVMGLSGSGKSTLVRCLIRLILATKGRIRFDGEDILDFSPEQLMLFRRTKIAMVFQHYALLPHRRVLDNVAYGLEIRCVDRPDRYRAAEEAIETVGLKGWEGYYPRAMSGGMQQRVGLARALAVNPEVLLMDEPFSGLDPLIRREMQDELISLQSELRKTIVFITHDLNEALKLGDRIAIMRDGGIVQEGSPDEIVALPRDDYVAEFVRDVSRAKFIQVASIMKRPSLVLRDEQSPEVALQAMRAHGVDRAFLVGSDYVFKGIVTANAVNGLIGKAEASLGKAEIVTATTTDRQTHIEDIIPLAAQTEEPIAVVGDGGRLLGEIDRGTLLEGMSAIR
ncbi:MAG: glycine betaine/L-proline ABC transporter ATP-binding protein [Dehalococcoidia bacterium]|nr:glycine betaine/L-proline ABC transporter ATP-binding protein [Dehalococcoidia bacterium]